MICADAAVGSGDELGFFTLTTRLSDSPLGSGEKCFSNSAITSGAEPLPLEALPDEVPEFDLGGLVYFAVG
ncbi:unnamed protein product [Linum trigynum]|uniref:Uncharacterized protein n=1 Tax=Linum trigynum TaxID=586398 RepID=A0AAV2FUM2_9ROSI